LFCVDEASAMRDSVRGEHISLVPLNILRMNCRPWNGRLFPLVFPAPELSRFCCNGIQAATVRSFIQAAGSRKSRHWCTPPLQGGNVTSAQRAFAVVPLHVAFRIICRSVLGCKS
jgi:hypothetical protein